MKHGDSDVEGEMETVEIVEKLRDALRMYRRHIDASLFNQRNNTISPLTELHSQFPRKLLVNCNCPCHRRPRTTSHPCWGKKHFCHVPSDLISRRRIFNTPVTCQLFLNCRNFAKQDRTLTVM